MRLFRIVKTRSKSEGYRAPQTGSGRACSLMAGAAWLEGGAGRAFPHGNLFELAPALLHCAQRFL